SAYYSRLESKVASARFFGAIRTCRASSIAKMAASGTPTSCLHRRESLSEPIPSLPGGSQSGCVLSLRVPRAAAALRPQFRRESQIYIPDERRSISELVPSHPSSIPTHRETDISIVQP